MTDKSTVTPAGPGLARRALNLGWAAFRQVGAGLPVVSDEVYDERLSICRTCTSCNVDRMICLEPSCGCSLASKARWGSSDCPLGKWPSTPKSSEPHPALREKSIG